MRLALGDEELEFGRVIGSMLDEHCTPDVVRGAWLHNTDLDRELWARLVEMGATSVLVPVADGGLGLDIDHLVPALEAAGRHCLPHPLVETAMVAAPLLSSEVGSTMIATNLGGPIVANALDADAFLLGHDGGLHLVSRDRVRLEPLETVDMSRRAARISAWTGGDRLVGDRDAAFDRGALGTAAVLLGLCDRMVELSVNHVSERHQFGVPVGSFQAVKHMLADALKDLQFARPALLRGVHSARCKAPSTAHDVSVAMVLAIDAATTVGRAALQAHGAIGYTVEHDLHLYLKRAWALTRSWGGRSWHRDRVEQAVFSK